MAILGQEKLLQKPNKVSLLAKSVYGQRIEPLGAIVLENCILRATWMTFPSRILAFYVFVCLLLLCCFGLVLSVALRILRPFSVKSSTVNWPLRVAASGFGQESVIWTTVKRTRKLPANFRRLRFPNIVHFPDLHRIIVNHYISTIIHNIIIVIIMITIMIIFLIAIIAIIIIISIIIKCYNYSL